MTIKAITSAPDIESINRDSDGQDNKIVIQSLTEQQFDEARRIENAFVGSKGCCFGLCSYSWCPTSTKEFESIYRDDPDRRSTYGVAIRQSDQTVVGVITLRQGNQASTTIENFFHSPGETECYVDHITVTQDARRMGIGTQLLSWADEKAKERGATKITLGVVRGNPAKRLYERHGYIDKRTFYVWPWLLLGLPHGQFGADLMEKQLTSP
jgi:ribosomal protein S18 acetylase RimI-like enzyme